MKLSKKDIEFDIIWKKINQELTTKEESIFEDWVSVDKKNKDFFKKVETYYTTGKVHDEKIIHLLEAWNTTQQKIKTKSSKKKKPKINKLIYRYAAIFIGLFGIGYLIHINYLLGSKESQNVITETEVKIAPGFNKAILTLEDGSNLVLEKGEEYKIDNIKSDGNELVYSKNIDSKEKPVYNYLTVPRGAEFQVTLSDGTKVWLNSESQLKYPVVFNDKETRQVELVYGEAYFDVSPSTKNSGTTFKVKNRIQELEVLGTEFNIKAYQDETVIYTTLVEGIIEVKNNTGKVILKPNEQSNISSLNEGINVIKNVDVFNEVSWRDGVFSFEKKSLKYIMKVLSRWYDTNIVFYNKDLEGIKFTGVLSKDQNLEGILFNIKELGFVKSYKITSNNIILE